MLFPEITRQKKTENELYLYRQYLEDLVKLRTEELENAKNKLVKALEKEIELSKFKSQIVSTV